MKVTIKNFKQDVYVIDIDDTNTVLELKKRLEQNTNNELPAESQTLIYAGVILEDNKQLKDYKIDEKKFLVVMKKKSAAPRSETQEKSSSGPLAKPSPNPAPGPEGSKQNSVPNAGEEIVTRSSSDSLTDPIEIRNVINSIVEMGYPEEEVIRALKASFNNPDRAVEYLVQGIPLTAESEVSQPRVAGTETPESVQVSEDRTPLAFLRNDARFQQMRRLLRDDPSLLNGVITQIGQTNPRLLQLIRENQSEFIRLLNEPDEDESMDSLPDIPVITITDQEREAIERLKALGFPEELVIQAYFACDKNEQQAANFLLSQTDED